MTEIEQATEALIAAINAARLRLPRRNTYDGARAADTAERQLRVLCENAIRLVHQQDMRIQRRRDSRSARPGKEEKAEAALQQQVVDVGYRTLAAKLHPDAGGSNDAMQRLNQARDRLKGKGR
jgi:hypothetical protein